MSNKEQGTCSWEQGTLAKKQPGTGNTDLKTAGNREHGPKSSQGLGKIQKRTYIHEFGN